MSPVHADDVGASYANQLVACVVLIVCVSVAVGIYIARLNAHVDRQRELSSLYLRECHNGRGGFIVYPDGRRSSDRCYTAEEDEVTNTNDAQDLPGSSGGKWLEYLLPAVELPRMF
ncbi:MULTISPECIES: hypothetical protein [Pseudomonas fluorescens group]|uniref:Uncharacterized protein n=1 Tax=Pseudomonas fluorescens TaxID=294 RepID=A0A0D0TIE4_PSEFL|nr:MULTISPECIES: hypothetical protein [Pseudomonas fluorescens group]AZE62285.1 hypothetical protein C4K02_3939 [Pseudomonas synxantha]KIR23081.1 hypothetical protein PFLU3_14930 [Pseudomonas fluorescens]